MRLDRWLKRYFPTMGFSNIQKLTRSGQLRVDSKRTLPQTLLTAGQEVRLPVFDSLRTAYDRRPVTTASPEDIKLFKNCIISEDDDYLVINKFAGIAVQGGTNTERHLDLILRTLWPDPAHCPKITHRLDRDTSGILVFAKNHESARWLGESFKHRSVHKRYLAIVVGTMPEPKGFIDAALAKMGGESMQKMEVYAAGDSAETHYHVLKTSLHAPLSYVEFQPLTGRTHQIRVHAAHLNCPILGDGKYGGKRAHPLDQRTSICLHASALSFTGQNGKNYAFSAPVPEDFQNVLKEYF